MQLLSWPRPSRFHKLLDDIAQEHEHEVNVLRTKIVQLHGEMQAEVPSEMAKKAAGIAAEGMPGGCAVVDLRERKQASLPKLDVRGDTTKILDKFGLSPRGPCVSYKRCDAEEHTRLPNLLESGGRGTSAAPEEKGMPIQQARSSTTSLLTNDNASDAASVVHPIDTNRRSIFSNSSCGSSGGQTVELVPLDLWVGIAPRAKRRPSINRGRRPSIGNHPHEQSPEAFRRQLKAIVKKWALVEFFERFVVSPNAGVRILWDILSILVLLYDLIFLPLHVFDLPDTFFFTCMAWTTLTFWTLDMLYTFFVGYYQDGVLERGLFKIAMRYAKTWLPFDLLMVFTDWLMTVTDAFVEDLALDTMGMMRFGKIMRMLRLFRLLRLLKVQGMMSDCFERMMSESALILLGVVKLLFYIMFANHLIACAWYSVGTWNENTGKTWVIMWAARADDETIASRYFSSLHWSLTQFTPASMEVVPVNLMERVYAVLVIMLAMVTFSSFVSTITNAMTRLRNLDKEKDEQYSKLRKYIMENQVSTALMSRILGCLQKEVGHSRRRILRDDVGLLKLLPWGLEVELLIEIYSPVFSVHPLFSKLTESGNLGMQKVYSRTIHEIWLTNGQQVFNPSTETVNLYIVLEGFLNYGQDNFEEAPVIVERCQWAAEASLWVHWQHVGQAICGSECAALQMDPGKLADTLAFNLGAAEHQVRKYAKSFAQYFGQHPEHLSDVLDPEHLQLFVKIAFDTTEQKFEQE